MKTFTFEQQNNVSLREKVTNDIRTAILNGELQSGSRLKETEIAEQMGVSRGPIREAIRQLEREGLLISYPYRETVVADINIDEVKDILVPIRLHLESFVIRRYITQVDEAFIAQMQGIVDRMALCYEERKLDKMVELDVLFHETIISLAAERTVWMTWRSILNQTRLHFIKNTPHLATEAYFKDHQKLLNVIASKDLELILVELRLHLDGDESFLFT